MSNNGLCSESVYLSVSETANLFGVSKQAIQKKCQLGRYATRTVTKRGGTAYEILLSSLPAEIQEKYYAELAAAEPGKALELAAVNPAAEIAIAKAQMEKELTASAPAELPEADRTHLPKAIADKEVNKKAQAVQEAVNVPAGWLVKKWQEAVAVKYEITYSTLRRWIEKFEKGGVTKLLHQNKVTKRSVKWDEEAVDYLRGLYLKAEHRKIITSEIKSPSDDLVRHFTRQVFDGKITERQLAYFKDIVRKSFQEVISETVSNRLTSALNAEKEIVAAKVQQEVPAEPEKSAIETTQQEIDGFNIVRAICSKVVKPERIAIRDNQSYCNVLLDDNIRKQICRLHFNNPEKLRVQILGPGVKGDRNLEVDINSPEDLFGFADQILKAVHDYDNPEN